MTTLFTVVGPFKIPVYQGRAGRTITDENTIQFWKEHSSYASQRGCYVFGVRASKGYRPAYAGRATKNFKQEVFSHHKLTRYQQYLADVSKGSPVMFFLIAPKKRGTPNAKHIEQLEDFLIQAGVAANPAFLNIRGTRVEEWGIAGVLRSGKGKRSASASEFVKLMKISD
ncbi:MAG TPA: hypothetical protein VNU65_01645 [Xanthobacteraceae bacterium]|jgi:hypothetical protein|nr:hypothetical protein [Xanthobacteraceae bacterium]